MDLRATSAGALRYASWLRRHGGDSLALHALHVVEQLDQHYAIKLGMYSRGHLLGLTTEATRAALQTALVEEYFDEVGVLPGGAAHEVLDEQLVGREATGLVVGRQGPLREGFPPRLGPVARRLLRHAGGPVVVVPPDLNPAVLTGSIVLATDLGPSSMAATRFAAARAREWGRPLRIVHVLRREGGGLSFLPRDAQDGARAQRRRAARETAEAWVAAQDFEGIDVQLELPVGSAVEELLAVTRRGSPLVVCGARRLSWARRRLEASHASSLCSHAPVPVAVVPPDPNDVPETSS